MNKKALIIGGGFAGCSAAHQLELIGNWDVTLIEKANYLGAGNKTRWYGGHPYTFGPRHFLTPYQEVFDYIDKIIPIRKCPEHEFLTYVERDNAFYAYPINMQDVREMPDYEIIDSELKSIKESQYKGVKFARNLEEYWIASVGQTLYSKMIDKYNKKMWLVEDNKSIDTFNWSPKGVALKDGPRAAWDSAISGYPYAKDGYDKYFPFATKNTKVLLNTTCQIVDINKKKVLIEGEEYYFDLIISSIAPDIFLNEIFGPLKYIGRELKLMVFPSEYIFPENVYFLYYANAEPFTRLVEYKKFTHHKSNTTLVGMEIPALNGGYEYPVPFKEEQKKAMKYYEAMPEGVYSIGRAGSYLYGIDIDDCIRQTMIISEELKEGGQDNTVPGKEYQFPEL
ncbi:FAD-dependent oxidoreductase [Prochlorococcus marinus]|uniref:UDP-galactopyranose mutase n=1 Tax=Prochlorococcus marinus (strain AS9601) TaxID=146891 RepID=A2BSI1_PROMS|nr:FAD-dependent oxidoreductase [Prochlorococcus marinus]ABM70742.1 UDP-galactopyranose mutase [Prochlorococcus marinus str. AS9601]